MAKIELIAEAKPALPFGLLGQESFFSRFDVSFNYRDKTILLKR